MREEALLRVERVGVRGDGVAHHRGAPVYLPFTVPGDVVRVALGEGGSARVLAIETPGPRSEPRCPHFGACGGCALQHLPDVVYAETKIAWLVTALAQQGLGDVAVLPPLLLPPGTRRRARLAMRRPRDPQSSAEIGFLARASHRIVDLRHCAVLDPALTALAQRLRAFVPRILAPGEKGAATATRAEAGVDLLLELDAAPDLAGLEALADFANGADLARLSWRNEGSAPVPVAERRPVRLTFGGIAVDLPPGVFLQASPDSDTALAHEVCAGVSGARHVADLYAGIGTFTLPLAATARIHAVDGAADAVAALGAAIRRAGLDGRVSIERRDLAARPLQPDELSRFDAVVFDPPFAGARTQSAALARSSVPIIVAISCNPATFARDASILVDGGYRLLAVQPVDSFLWSANLELVARFERM